jgi:hypothetical protein
MSRPGPTVATQNAGAGGVETLTFPSVVNRYIRLLGITRAMAYGYSLFEFQVYGADIPAILTEPASQTVNSSSTATFSATVGGDGPFTYQWLRNGVAIPGATTTSYATPAVMSADSGSTFAIAVTNASATSISATLTVNSSAPTRPNLALNQRQRERRPWASQRSRWQCHHALVLGLRRSLVAAGRPGFTDDDWAGRNPMAKRLWDGLPDSGLERSTSMDNCLFRIKRHRWSGKHHLPTILRTK